MGILGILFGTLGASLLGNMSAEEGTNRAGDEIIRAVYGYQKSLIKISSKNKYF